MSYPEQPQPRQEPPVVEAAPAQKRRHVGLIVGVVTMASILGLMSASDGFAYGVKEAAYGAIDALPGPDYTAAPAAPQATQEAGQPLPTAVASSPTPEATPSEEATDDPSPTPEDTPTDEASATAEPSQSVEANNKDGMHVLWVMYENRGIDQMGNATYLKGLAQRFGDTNGSMHGRVHPSLGNYLDLSNGRLNNVTDDDNQSHHPITTNNIWHQLNGNWTAYVDGMHGNCAQKNQGSTVIRHNMPVYMTNDDDQAACQEHDIPFKAGDPIDLSKKLTYIDPDNDHNAHNDKSSKGVATADKWTEKVFGDPDSPEPGTVFDSPEWKAGKLVVMFSFDESSGSYDKKHKKEKQVIPTYIVSKQTDHVLGKPTSQGGYDYHHSDMLATTEYVLGLPILPGQSGGAGYVKAADGKTPQMAVKYRLA